jgi:hypothetical protein
MKQFRSWMISVAALLMLLGLVATGAKAQSMRTTDFAGRFTLPFAAQWGDLTLVPGEYNLYYGNLNLSGPLVVEVAHENVGIVHGVVLARGRGDAKGEGSFLVCVTEGNRAYVRSLQMGEIGQSVGFARPRGVSVAAWIVAGKKTHNTNTRLAETRIPILPAK